MRSKALTFNERIIQFIKEHDLRDFSVVQLRDAYVRQNPQLSPANAYKMIYKAIWQMHGQGVFFKTIDEDNTATYAFTPEAESILHSLLTTRKTTSQQTKVVVPSLKIKSSNDVKGGFIQELISELPLLESEMLAKKAEAQEYQRFLSRLPEHKDMLVAKFSIANAEGIQLLGRITAIQRVLSEFKSYEA